VASDTSFRSALSVHTRPLNNSPICIY